MKRFLSMGAFAVTAALAVPAFADEVDVDRDDDTVSVDVDRDDYRSELNQLPWDVSLQAGVGGFTDAIGDQTQVGPIWGVRVGTNAMGVLGGELAYEGGRLGLESGNDAAMFRHNVTALAKAGINITPNLRPFAGVGLGLTYMNVNDEGENIGRNDWLEEIPLAAGLEYQLGMLTAGLRASYSFMINDEFIEPTPDLNNPAGGLVQTSLTLGGRF
jgi:opacity protein-like surface antigen